MRSAAPSDRATTWALTCVALVTLYRLALLPFDAADLYTDDAQYWLWGQELAWGYYSKPPLIGWILRLATAIGGDGMIAIRAPLPLLHAATALAILATGRAMFGPRAGAIAGAAYVTAPAVAVASLLVSTDTPMLLCIALALGAHWRLTRVSSAGWAVVLGLAAGLGMLAKYAMLYFAFSAVLAALTQAGRIAWRDALLALGVGLALVAPNLWWNYVNSFSAVTHVVDDNAGLGHAASYDLGRALGLLAAQFAVAGPVIFGAYLIGLGRVRRDPRVGYLALFSLPPLVVLFLVALRSDANANWAAAAHVPAFLLAGLMLRDRPRWTLAGLAINLALTLALPAASLFATTFRIGDDLVFRRYLGRAEVSRHIAEVAGEAGLDTIVSGDRSTLADAFYTLRDSGLSIYAEPVAGFPPHHYAQKHPLPPGPGDVLFVGTSPTGPDCRDPAARGEEVARWRASGYSTREFHAWRVPRACFFAPD
ncbi:ArnT family glycosyltransferase [Amaricoccus solimangrovi]|uniref:Glycosyltransferase family 39 protein n=1 Tax=Amaricoccus solimangrovi TaxID=2589815 RepID=A0A501WV64_9RHOB|nr:glycosyltransferase family 39 protein [Amaricoccus solimangrovi]TPE52642.1 glycosyltransferase family 39 protein [Amaricoccus solimangrovi]